MQLVQLLRSKIALDDVRVGSDISHVCTKSSLDILLMDSTATRRSKAPGAQLLLLLLPLLLLLLLRLLAAAAPARC